METGLLEHRYRLLRNHLDDLGYRQCLVIECLPLVERLVSDLLRTTESLRHYKELAQKSLEKCSNLELGSEPYKLDNARLVKECNELHLNLLHQQEDAQKAQKELKLKVRKLESENSDLQFLSSQSIAKIKALEQESAQKTRKILQLQNKGVKSISVPGGKKKHIPSKSQPTFELDSPLKPAKSCQEQYWNASAQATDPYIANMVEISEKRISCLNRELNLLREEKNQQAEIIATFKNQLNNRDREIHRLTSMLEGGRPITAIRKDCCCSCKDTISQIDSLTSEVKRLKIRKEELEQEVKDSVANQHEAMTRAVMLAERNKKLEQELRDIDQMALAVEAECNSTVKENSIRVSKIQEKLDNSLMQIHDLEREVLELKRNNQELQASVEGVKNEKKHLQRKLESVVDEKKKNVDRLNELTIIERGLNNEIERMAQESAMQRRKIADLESQLNSKRTRSETIPEKSSVQRKVRSGKRTKSKSPSLPAASKSATSPSRRRAATPPKRSAGSSPRRTSPARRSPLSPQRKSLSSPERKSPSETRGHTSNRISKESAHEYNPKLNPEQYEKLIEKLQEERDFYYQECLKSKEVSANSDNNKEMQWRLNEKEKQLQELKKANQELLKEKQILQTRLNSGPNKESHSTMTSPKAISPTCLDQCSTMSLKTMLKRLEQERDLARGDVMRLEEERDALRERLKIATETQVAEHARLEKTVIESEERVRKLEAERRELLSSQGSKKATISNMENHIESTQTKLVSLQTELSEQRALYNQIKSLQEQTDRALADSQGQLVQAEMELTNARDRVRQLEKERAGLDHEVATLKNEVSVMRGSLAQVDQEKDGLLISIDTKTERIAMLEQELKTKEDRTLKLEENLTEVKKKLSIALDDLAGRDSKARNAEKEVERLRRELEMSERARESALNENRLLHNDLAAITEDLRKSNHDLELARQEVENLKRQLQDYVTEVRRVEELLSRKEEERGEMLDHYRSLSLEASALENNNHSLETEVQEARTQLRLANDRLIDLQHQIEARDSLVHGYENQIAELSANVAKLETQLHEELNQRRHSEEQLSIVRDLCTKLDAQKEGLMNQVTENDLVKMQLETELARLRDEQELLQEQIARDHEAIQTLENLLSSCRQETLDQKVSNQETQTEVNSLRRKVTELQEKLAGTTSDLQRCQQQAAEYSQNMTELQRTLTNERFERAREEETRRQVGYSSTVPLSPLPSSYSQSTSIHSGQTYSFSPTEQSRMSPSPPQSFHPSSSIPVPTAPPLSPQMSTVETNIVHNIQSRSSRSSKQHSHGMNKHHSKLSQPSLPTTSRSLSRVSEKSLPVPAHPSSSKSSRHKMTNPDLTNPIFDDDLNVNVSVNQTMPYSLPQYTSVKSCVTTTTQSKYDTIPQYMSTAPSLPSSSSVRNYHRQTVNPNLFPPQPPSVSSGFEKSDINQANQNLEDVLNVNVSVNQSSVPQSTSVTTTVTSTSQSRFIYDNNTSSNFSRAQQVIPPYNSAEVNNYMPPGSFQNKNKFTGATSVASYPKEDENNFAEVNPTRSHDPRTCSKKNCSGKGCGKKCPKKVCIMEPSSQNIPRTDLSQRITNTSSQSHLPLHSTGRTQSSKLFPSNQSFAGNVESPHFPKSNSFPSPSQFSSSRRMHTSKTDIGRTAEMSHTSISNNIHQIPSTRIEASQLSHLKPNLADQSNPPPSLDSQLGEKTFHSTFTSIGIPVLSYDATYTVVRLNEGKAITNTTLSIQDSNVHSSSSEQALSYVSGVERISKHPKNNSNRIVNPSSVRGKVQPTSAPLSQRNADFQTSGYSSEFQNQQPSIINSSGQNIYQNYETMQHPAHTSKCNVRQVSFKNLQDVQTDKSSDVSIPSHCKNYRRDDFNSPILQSGAYPSTAQYGLNLYSNEQKELPAHKSTWSHQNRDESRFSTRPLRKQETTVVTNIVRNPESGKS